MNVITNSALLGSDISKDEDIIMADMSTVPSDYTVSQLFETTIVTIDQARGCFESCGSYVAPDPDSAFRECMPSYINNFIFLATPNYEQ